MTETHGQALSQLAEALLLAFLGLQQNQPLTGSESRPLSLQAGSRMLVAKAAASRLSSLYSDSSRTIPCSMRVSILEQQHPDLDIAIADEVPELVDISIDATDAGFRVEGNIRCWTAGVTELLAWNEGRDDSVHSLEITSLTVHWDKTAKAALVTFTASLPLSLLPPHQFVCFQAHTCQWFSAIVIRYESLRPSAPNSCEQDTFQPQDLLQPGCIASVSHLLWHTLCR